MLARIKEDRQANKELLARMDAFHEKRMAMLDDHQKNMLATKKSEQDTEMTQSAEVHQDVPNEDVAVMLVGEPRKRCRVRKSTAGRRGEPKELNRGNHGSRRKLAAACRKVSRHAAVVWRKRKLFRRTGTQEICGRRKELTVAGMRMTRRARLAWGKENFFRKDCTRKGDERATQRLGPLRKNLCTTHKGKGKTNYIGGRRPLDVRKKRETGIGIRGWTSGQLSPMRMRVPAYKTLQKTFRRQIVKRAKEVSSGLRKTRKWNLWMGRPPPKCKKRLHTE
jgi:hypothetical protein